MSNQSITKSVDEFLDYYNSLASKRDGSIINTDFSGIYVILQNKRTLLCRTI